MSASCCATKWARRHLKHAAWRLTCTFNCMCFTKACFIFIFLLIKESCLISKHFSFNLYSSLNYRENMQLVAMAIIFFVCLIIFLHPGEQTVCLWLASEWHGSTHSFKNILEEGVKVFMIPDQALCWDLFVYNLCRQLFQDAVVNKLSVPFLITQIQRRSNISRNVLAYCHDAYLLHYSMWYK